MKNSFRKHKQHRHHYDSHVVVPGSPLSDLVIGHAAFAFRILKSTLDPIALSLHPAQPFKRGPLWGIGQRNLCVWIIPQSLRYNQCPGLNLIGLAIPYVNFQTTNPDPEYTTGGFRSVTFFQRRGERPFTRSRTSIPFSSLLYFLNRGPGFLTFFGK